MGLLVIALIKETYFINGKNGACICNPKADLRRDFFKNGILSTAEKPELYTN